MMFNERTYSFGLSSLTLKFANILDSNAEVLVSSDDFMLSMGGGVSKAIARAAGSAMVLDAMKSVPRKLGDVVVTSAGALDARYIFHVVTIGPEAISAESPEEFVKRATQRCMDLMEVLDLVSISFPALGTGVAGISMEGSAAAMADVVCERLSTSDRAYSVSFCFHADANIDSRSYVAFFEEFARLKPRIARHESRHGAGQAASRPPTTEAASRLLQLEQERQVLEQQIVMLKSADDVATAERLSERLIQNQTARLDAAYQDRSSRDRPVGVFISYAREDAPFREQLTLHLSSLEQQGLIHTWTDREIGPGSDWDSEINEAINSAELFIFLVSAYSMSSDYIRGVEMTRAFERARTSEATVIPVLARSYDLADYRFAKLQHLPSDGRPIDLWGNEHDAYVDVIRGIRRTIETIRRRPRS
ncbi:macro domain-containing protein [Mycobacterium sp. GA-1199]|uniref:macro domain-containing protein n=1 Tax=Mycobacterium sp. GA-1199 TaxID=1772287 RepID=UPI000ACD3581|nr:macro domain-containing protein [Mycobacterium sp. GA-1199]